MDRAPLSGMLAAALIALLVTPAGVASVARAQAPGCVVESATLDWGFKESFRAYIDGSIANGEWTASGGAVYETPEFGWRDGVGRLDSPASGETVSFVGEVRFTGHGGILDTTIANPVLRVDADGTAVLLLDVTGATMDGDLVEAIGIPFVTVDLPRDFPAGVTGVTSIDGAATVLTDEGAAAFPNYDAGTAFDPISFTFDLGDCAIAAAAPHAPPDGGWAVAPVLALVVLTGTLIAAFGVRRRRT